MLLLVDADIRDVFDQVPQKIEPTFGDDALLHVRWRKGFRVAGIRDAKRLGEKGLDE